jgi:hypothetical protein
MEAARVSARQMWVVTESVHAVTYFAPTCRHALRDAGLKGFWAGYFTARAAPLGRVEAGTVAAAFFNFAPSMVTRVVPSCWEAADPAELTVLRAGAAAAALIEVCSSDALDAMVAALPALRRAAAHCAGEGRIMTGVNRELWPSIEAGLRRRALSEAHKEVAEVWQACTTLREHRGDGHVASLVGHGLSGLEAHLLAVATLGQPAELLRDNRGWTEEEWEEGRAGLIRRGLLASGTDSEDAATPAGVAVHDAVEEATDLLAAPPYDALADDEIAGLYGALRRGAAQIQDSGLLPFPNPIGLPAL